jgi:leader peptidase (prepilin peptidase) / N-methyltransferase
VNGGAALLVLAPAFAVGSFLNVVAARVPERRSLLRPASSCGACGEEILWRDNIPVLSYALLRGRCRHCHAEISPVYPLVEALTAALVVACVAVFGPTPYAALAAGFCCVLVVLSVIDARLRIVPNRVVLPAAAATLLLHTAIDPSPAWALWALAAAGVLFLVVLAYPKGLGMGDVKLALFLGAMLGGSVCVALMVGLFAALVPAAILLARHCTGARKMGVPLVPFLAFGSIVALFAGDWIVNAYLSLF